MIYFDTHCHLNSAQFKNDLDDVINRAKAANIKKIIVPGYSIESSRQAIKIANKFDSCYATIGIHPDDCILWDDEIKDEFVSFLKADNKVIGVGEVGLDFHWDRYPREQQKKIFAEQVRLSAELSLPLVVHSRNAEIDCLEILKKEKPYKAVFHCYGGDIDVARMIWHAGYFISFTANITYPQAQNLRDIVFECPLDRLMIETDAPYLAPQNRRGERCEPTDVLEVFNRIAEIKDLPEEDLAERIYKNSLVFFNLSD